MDALTVKPGQIRSEAIVEWACRNICKYRDLESPDELTFSHCAECALETEAIVNRKALDDVSFTGNCQTCAYQVKVDRGWFCACEDSDKYTTRTEMTGVCSMYLDRGEVHND